MKRLGHALRTLADRLDPDRAPRYVGWSFTFETGLGMTFRDDGRGCRLWYLSMDDYEQAHLQAGPPDPDRSPRTGFLHRPQGPDLATIRTPGHAAMRQAWPWTDPPDPGGRTW